MSIDAIAVRSTAAPPGRVRVGIDAAITANHHFCVRQIGEYGTVTTSGFVVPPTLARLRTLGARLSVHPDVP